jgi:hypothetical protein
LNQKGEQVALNFFRLDKNRVPKNLISMYDYTIVRLASLGIKINVVNLLYPEERFKAVANTPGFSVFLEYSMNEEILMDWTLNLKHKDKLMENLYRRFDREVIKDLRALLGRRMINYQTTQTHVFVPICSLKARDTFKRALATKRVLPFSTIEDLYKYTNY